MIWEDLPEEIAGGGSPTITYSDIRGLGGGTNIDEDPNFVDPDAFDFHLLPGSPCIDAGDNFYALYSLDWDGDQRIIDGDGDGTPTVDMGMDEVPLASCIGDFDLDGDVDGSDMSQFAQNYAVASLQADLNEDGSVNELDIELFAGQFGRECP